MPNQPELFARPLASVRALRTSLNEWMFAHWQLRDSARNTVIADFERMLGELDAVWSLLIPIHGPAALLHRLLTKHLETRFAPPGHPAGRDIVMPILAGKAGPRFTERENHNLVKAFDSIERELLKLAGESAPVPASLPGSPGPASGFAGPASGSVGPASVPAHGTSEPSQSWSMPSPQISSAPGLRVGSSSSQSTVEL